MYTCLDWLLGQNGGAWTTRLGIAASRAGRLQNGRPRLALTDVLTVEHVVGRYLTDHDTVDAAKQREFKSVRQLPKRIAALGINVLQL